METSRNSFDQLSRRLRSLADNRRVHILVDSTGHYSLPIIHYLEECEFCVALIRGASSKRLREHLVGTAQKSDAIDAKVLAYAIYLNQQLGLPIPVRSPLGVADEAYHLLHYWRLRKQLVRHRTQAINRLKSLLAAVFPEIQTEHWRVLSRLAAAYPTPATVRNDPALPLSRLTDASRERVVRLASASVGVTSPSLTKGIQIWGNEIEEFTVRIGKLEKEIAAEVQQHEFGAALTSIPGISNITASLLIGTIRTIERWDSAGALKRAFGFYGDRSQSGTVDRMTKGKGGDRDVKSALSFAILMAIRFEAQHPSDMADTYRRFRQQGVPSRKAVYKAASKLVAIIYACLRDGTTYTYRGGGPPSLASDTVNGG